MQSSDAMCGRFTSTASPEELKRIFGVSVAQNLCPSWNIAPNQKTLVVTRIGSQNEAVMAHWGIPFASSKKSLLINARCETVAEKPTFRNAFQTARCLVVASGWYEWSAPKKPWYMQLCNFGLMVFGGLLFSKANQKRFVILTTTADGALANIHHRAPLILSRDNLECWIGGNSTTAAGLLRSAPAKWFNWYRVGPDVGQVCHDHPELVTPLSDDELGMDQLPAGDLFA